MTQITIGTGITIGGGITFGAPYIAPIANLVMFYDAGNSMCYSGSGTSFNTSITGPNLSGYQQYGLLDLNGLVNNNWHSGNLVTNGSNNISWTNQGVASYWTITGAGGSFQYIDGSFQENGSVLNGGSFTLLSVVRPQDFTTGAIVGGDSNTFYFTPTGGLNDGPSLVAGSYGGQYVTDGTTAFETNQWYCVAVTYNAATEVMKLYTNGVNVATSTNVPPATATSLYWGTLEGELWYTGDMSVCMAWTRPLRATELANYSAVYLSRYIEPPATSSIVFSQPYLGNGPPTIFTVPEGVTSISVVAVGGGGGGTQSEYAIPGADTAVLRNDNSVIAQTLYTGQTNQITVDTAVYPGIANVTTGGGWVVLGADISNSKNIVTGFDAVTDVDTTDPSLTVVTTSGSFYSNPGDEFYFYQAVAAAEGGYEIPTYYYNAYNQNPQIDGPGGPGPRAQPLVSDGIPYGQGGVVDWTATYGIGGGGAGGYGIAGLAWSPTQAGEWYYVEPPGTSYNMLSFSNNNLTVTGLSGLATANQETSVLGTQFTAPSTRMMFSVNITQISGVSGYCGVGIATYNTNLWNYIGSYVDSVGYYDDGRVFIDSTPVATYAPFNEGGLIDIAVDTVAGLAWFRVSGGLWNNNVSANPSTGAGGLDISSITTAGSPISIAASPWYNTDTSIGDVLNIQVGAYYSVPSGFTFIPGVEDAGGTGGTGASYWGDNATPGTGGAGGGGGGRQYDTGAGGGGTGLYGRGVSGSAGTFTTVSGGVALGGGSGSPQVYTGSTGGQATPWNGGRGGWPGGAGGSAIEYYDGANGGALAYRNNYEVTPGQEFIVVPGVGGYGENGGGAGAGGAIRIVWPGDIRQFPATNVGIDTISVPTLDITASTFAGQSGTVTYNITSNGGSEILESGIVYGYLSDHQYSASTDTCDGYNATEQRTALRADSNCANPYTTGQSGSITQSVQVYQFGGETINVYAYARNAAGVAYSPTALSWSVVPCLASGTVITLADGTTRAIEELTMSDTVKVWDFDNGVGATAPILWLQKKRSTLQYNALYFSDGTVLKTIGQHRIFNKQAGKFTYPMTADTPIGTVTVKADGTEVTLVGRTPVYNDVDYYNIITGGGHMNCYAEGILTGMRYNNIYPIADMRFVKDSRVLKNRSEFAGIADRWINGLRLTEQTTDIKSTRRYIERLERDEDAETPEPARPAWAR